MRRQPPEPIEAGGQDSFVDVVTNLVGILIVLVLIVGVRVKPAWRASHAASPSAATDPAAAAKAAETAKAAEAKELAGLRATADGVERDVRQVARQIAAVDGELAERAGEREKVATMIAAAEHEIDAPRSKLAGAARDEFDLKRQADGLESELQASQSELQRARNAPPPVAELKHYMTPISRTVFGKEVHFRLCDHRIAYLPMDELLERAKTEIHGESGSLNELTDHRHIVGPHDGFTMEFTLSMEPGPERGQYAISLNQSRFLPAPGQVGETTDEALGADSEFRRHLNTLDRQLTTVTIWVYPESFPDYRRINDELYRLGFGIAARPLPVGMPVGASNHGTRSARSRCFLSRRRSILVLMDARNRKQRASPRRLMSKLALRFRVSAASRRLKHMESRALSSRPKKICSGRCNSNWLKLDWESTGPAHQLSPIPAGESFHAA